MRISVVVPTWNEAGELTETMRRLRAVREVEEIIISDGNSSDATVPLARAAGAQVLSGAQSRGGQLRRGAEQAAGDIVWLVHADTWVPSDSGQAIIAALGDPRVVGGACFKEFRDAPWLARGSAWRCGVRMRWSQFAYGDQAIFVRRVTLDRVGGVPDVPLMEEHLLCSALRREGKLALAPVTVTTSSRRLRQRGVLRAYWRMGWINFLFRLGASPESLRRRYEQR